MLERGGLVLLLSLVAGCAGASAMPVSISRDPTIAARVHRSQAWVESDRPADPSSEDRIAADVLLAIASDAQVPRLAAAHAQASARVWTALEALEIVSARYLTRYRNKPAWHQVTVGVVPVPYRTFLERFDPAADWGRNLSDYLGGEVVVDQRAEDGRTTLQRERMVLGTPWYAIGSPNLDMEKYEVITRKPDATRIAWIVTASQNASVEMDVGYLVFRGVDFDSFAATLVAFNSVHRVETGLFSFESGLVGDNIAGAFVSHIEQYRRVVQAP